MSIKDNNTIKAIKRSDFFRRYFVEARKYPLVGIMYFLSFFFILFFYIFFILQLTPVVGLDEMDKKRGVVLNITGKKSCGQYVFLEVEGKKLKYQACLKDDEKDILIGKEVTVWSQRIIGGVFYRYNRIRQIKLGDEYINDFPAIFERSLKNHKAIVKLTKVFFMLFIFSLVIVWLKLRKINLPTN